jgi:hypothetical protein
VSELRLTFLQGAFGLLSFGDIAGDTLHSDGDTILANHGTVDLERQPAVVFCEAVHLITGLFLATLDLFLQMLSRSFEVCRRRDLLEVHSQRLFTREAEHTFAALFTDM